MMSVEAHRDRVVRTASLGDSHLLVAAIRDHLAAFPDDARILSTVGEALSATGNEDGWRDLRKLVGDLIRATMAGEQPARREVPNDPAHWRSDTGEAS